MDERTFYNYNLFMRVFSVEEYAKQLYLAISGAEVCDLHNFSLRILCNAIYVSSADNIGLLIQNNMTLYQSKSQCSNNLQYMSGYVSEYMSEHVADKISGFMAVNCKGSSCLKENEKLLKRVMLCNDELLNADRLLSGDMQIINLSAGKSEVLKRKCGILYELTIFISVIRRMVEHMKIEEAVCRSIDYCINNGILRDFFLKNKEQIKDRCTCEYLKEKQTDKIIMESTRLSYNAGFKTGLIKGKRIGENKNIKNHN